MARAIKEDEHVVRIISAAMPCQRSVMTPLYRPRALSLLRCTYNLCSRVLQERAMDVLNLVLLSSFFFFFCRLFRIRSLRVRERSRGGRWSWAVTAGWLNCLAAELFLNGCFSDTVLTTLFRTAVERAISGAHKLLRTGGFPISLTLLFWWWLTVSSVFTGRNAGTSCTHRYPIPHQLSW